MVGVWGDSMPPCQPPFPAHPESREGPLPLAAECADLWPFRARAPGAQQESREKGAWAPQSGRQKETAALKQKVQALSVTPPAPGARLWAPRPPREPLSRCADTQAQPLPDTRRPDKVRPRRPQPPGHIAALQSRDHLELPEGTVQCPVWPGPM